MKRIRQNIDYIYKDWGILIGGKILVGAFGKLTGQQLISARLGYTVNHPVIILLCYKQFLLKHKVTDEDVCSQDFFTSSERLVQKNAPVP